MCELKYSREVQHHSKHFIYRLFWYVTFSNKNMQGKNRCCPFINWHSGKIWRHHLQEQYQMVCVIRSSNNSIQRISITIWVFTYSVEYLHNHRYSKNSNHSKWTIYMPIISSTIYLVQMKTAVTINSRHYLLSKNTWSNLHLKKIPNWRVQPLLMLI